MAPVWLWLSETQLPSLGLQSECVFWKKAHQCDQLQLWVLLKVGQKGHENGSQAPVWGSHPSICHDSVWVPLAASPRKAHGSFLLFPFLPRQGWQEGNLGRHFWGKLGRVETSYTEWTGTLVHFGCQWSSFYWVPTMCQELRWALGPLLAHALKVLAVLLPEGTKERKRPQWENWHCVLF